MNIKNTITITEARKEIFNLSAKVQKPGVYYTLTENGVPSVVLMSAEEFDSWQETMEVMADFPDILKDIEQAEREYKNGDYITWEDMKKELHLANNNKFFLGDHSKKKYAVQTHRTKKSSKRYK